MFNYLKNHLPLQNVYYAYYNQEIKDNKYSKFRHHSISKMFRISIIYNFFKDIYSSYKRHRLLKHTNNCRFLNIKCIRDNVKKTVHCSFDHCTEGFRCINNKLPNKDIYDRLIKCYVCFLIIFIPIFFICMGFLLGLHFLPPSLSFSDRRVLADFSRANYSLYRTKNLTIGLLGRLGNRMFQLAALYGIAKANGFLPVIFDDDALISGTFRSFNKIKVIRKTEVWNHFGLDYLVYRERKPNVFDSQTYSLNFMENVRLEGFFQSWRYFDHVRSEIRRGFQCPSTERDIVAEYLSELARDYSISADKLVSSNPVNTVSVLSGVIEPFSSGEVGVGSSNSSSVNGVNYNKKKIKYKMNNSDNKITNYSDIKNNKINNNNNKLNNNYNNNYIAESGTKIIFIGVHVRRGDFLEDQNVRKGYTVSGTDYFRKAFQFYRDKFQRKVEGKGDGKNKAEIRLIFVVCSDDPDWVETNLLKDKKIVSEYVGPINRIILSRFSRGSKQFVFGNSDEIGSKKIDDSIINDNKNKPGPNIGDPIFFKSVPKSCPVILDLCLLTACNHSVITGGSFGWWGAWLAGGLVVYDQKYPRKGSVLRDGFKRDDYYLPQWYAL